jgi:heterodisulfide reductase subunit B
MILGILKSELESTTTDNTTECVINACPQCHGLLDIVDIRISREGYLVINVCSC